MPIEHEAKVLDINQDAVKARILAVGGEQVGEARLMRRYVYDIVPGDMSKWIRLRGTGSETTLCLKGSIEATSGGPRATGAARARRGEGALQPPLRAGAARTSSSAGALGTRTGTRRRSSRCAVRGLGWS